MTRLQKLHQYTTLWYVEPSRPVTPALEVGWPWKGVRGGGGGVLRRERVSKIEANFKHFRALVPFQCNYNERLFHSATNQEDTTIGDTDSSLFTTFVADPR